MASAKYIEALKRNPDEPYWAVRINGKGWHSTLLTREEATDCASYWNGQREQGNLQRDWHYTIEKHGPSKTTAWLREYYLALDAYRAA